MSGITVASRHISAAKLPHPPKALNRSLYSQAQQDDEGDQFGYRPTSTDTLNTGKEFVASPERKLWRPLSLHRRILAFYLLLSLAMLASTEAIYQVSEQKNGLAQVYRRDYYLWTYGPTAVLTLFGAFWTRLEYRCKQLSPWINMRHARTWSSNSIFMDYVSSWQPATIVTALRNADYLVASASSGALTITILIVISTGLLRVETVPARRSNVNVNAKDFFVNSTSGFSDLGTMPAYTVQGIQYLNLTHPTGTTDLYAYQSLDTATYPFGSIVETTVDGLSTELDCEDGQFDITSWTYQSILNTLIGQVQSISALVGPSLSTNSCRIDGLGVQLSVGSANTTQNFTVFSQGACYNSTDRDAQRIILLAGQVMVESETDADCPFQPSEGTMGLTCSNYTYKVLRSAQMICTPKYSLMSLDLRINNTESPDVQLTPLSTQSPWTLSQVHPWDIAKAFIDNFASVQPWSGSGANTSMSASLVGIHGPAMAMILDKYPSLTISSLLNSTLLQSLGSDLFQRTGAQIAKSALLQNGTVPLSGTVTINEDRLVVSLLSTRLMETLFILLACLIIILLITTPRDGIVTQDPDSLILIAAILKDSQSLVQMFEGTGAASLRRIQSLIPKSHRWTTNDETELNFVSSTRHKADKRSNESSHKDNAAFKPRKWYHPIVLRLWVIALACFLVSATIIALEISLYFSQKNNGLGSATKSSYMHYLWSYLPALLVVGIAMYYDSLDFQAKILEPFARLSASPVPFQQFPDLFLSKMPISALWSAIFEKNLRIFFTTLGMGVASFLAIVVSGVFSTHTVLSISDVSVELSGWFDLNSDYVSSSECLQDVGITAGLILDGNMSFPQWTYDRLAFPILEMSNGSLPISDNNASAIITLTTPAVRTTLNCTMFQGQDIVFTTSSEESLFNVSSAGCLADWPFGAVADGTFGFLSETTCLNLPDRYWQGAFWGIMSQGQLTQAKAIACEENYEQLNVNASFSLPDFAIDISNPPIADESSVQLPSELDDNTIFLWSYPESKDLPNIASNSSQLDGYFGAMVYGRYGIPIAYLTDSTHDQDVINSYQHVMSIVRAQQFSLCARVDAVQGSNTTLNGTATDTNQLWVVQNAVSTHVLQGLLGVVLLCGVAAAVLLRSRNVLPKNPCSIAAKVSLLADSSIVEWDNHVIPPDAEWMSNEELKKSHLLDGHMFRMGWFDGTEEEGGRFTIDVVDTGETPNGAPAASKERRRLLNQEYNS